MAAGLLPVMAGAQEIHPKSRKEKKTQTRNNTAMPSWGKAQHYKNDRYVYFPDYYTFYSPERGYTYYQNGNWTSSANMPGYMNNADLNKARTHKLNDVPNSAYPEKDFSTYINQYPAQSNMNPSVPVPPSP